MENKSYVESYLHTSEPVLFEVQTVISPEVHEAFQKFHYRTKNKTTFLMNTISSGALAFLGLLCLIAGEVGAGAFSLAVAAFTFFFPYFQLKKGSAEESTKGINAGNMINYKFYQDCYLDTDNYSVSAVPYGVVVEAHETEEYFYLYLSKYKASIIPKNAFLFNTPQEMRKLLSIKLGNKFILHCK